MTRRTRVHELAHEFGTTPEAVLTLLWSRGFPVRSVSSRVDAQAVEWLKFEFTIDQPIAPPPVPVVTHRQPATSPATTYVSARPRRGWPSWRSRRFSETLAFEAAWPREPSRRSSRSVPALGSNAAETAGLDLANIHTGLAGSPYSLPGERAEYLTTNFLPRVAALSIRAQREQARMTASRTARLRRVARSTEIYESNRLEGLGPDLATTDKVLHQYDLLRPTGVWAAERAIERCLDAEPKIRDVVGLGAARLLAEHFCADPARPLTGSDIRELHELILVGDRRGGTYKALVNAIHGSAHVPTSPSDTPAAMGQLVTWLADTELSPLWRAAVAHAWLTHIHPFHDGNGRVARLLANLVLIRNGMPPLIVSAASDRGAYLDALASSDEGGDILPLARVFRDVLSRGVQDLADPTLPAHVFNTQTDPRADTLPARWADILTEFVSELAPHLMLHRLNTYLIGDISAADLTRIGRGRLENAWVAKIASDATSRDLLLHVAAATIRPRHGPNRGPAPSIFVSVRNPRTLDARQYLPVGDQGSFAYEFYPIAETGDILIRRHAVMTRHPIHEAANVAADHLARSHRQLIGRHS